jgi:hypothetical protein
MLATVIDTAALLQVLWASFAAGVGLIVVFSLTIAGAARATHERHQGRRHVAVAWITVATVGALICAAAVVMGVLVMLSK